MNRKRVQRLWREEGCGYRSAGASANAWGIDRAGRAPAGAATNQAWAIEFQLRSDRRWAGC